MWRREIEESLEKEKKRGLLLLATVLCVWSLLYFEWPLFHRPLVDLPKGPDAPELAGSGEELYATAGTTKGTAQLALECSQFVVFRGKVEETCKDLVARRSREKKVQGKTAAAGNYLLLSYLKLAPADGWERSWYLTLTGLGTSSGV